jgi:hypothetical protein
MSPAAGIDRLLMLRTLALATLVFGLPEAVAVQDGRSLLQVRVVLAGGEQKPVSVPRHVLLISENPPTEPPRRLRTAPDGTASIRLRPGNYTVESDQPVTFQGKAYQWTQVVEIAAGRDAVLELTAGNAEVTTPSSPGAESATPVEADPSSLMIRWQDSVVAVWSPTAFSSGFVAGASGLVVTAQRTIGSAASVEVQLSPTLKVPARVLVADPVRDVAVAWIDPKAAASIPVVPVECAGAGKPPVAPGQEIVAIGMRLRNTKGTTSGTVTGIEGRMIAADFVLAPNGGGGPVFSAGGELVGVASRAGDDERGGRDAAQVVRIEEVCAAVAAAELKMADAAPPAGVMLPVESERPFPSDALAKAGPRSVDRNPYRASSSSYDITFITPMLLAASRQQPPANQRSRSGGRPDVDPRTIDPLDDFSNWSAYVAEVPPVLMIRVTPKLAEGFWTRIARGAAQTQGVSLPPIKRFKPGFARLEAFCGDKEVTPIHPFKLEQRVSESDAVYEGLYVFDPAALGPPCSTVRLVLYSEQAPQKGETSEIDPKVLAQIWEDLAPARAPK